jgi:hypothetical protein
MTSPFSASSRSRFGILSLQQLQHRGLQLVRARRQVEQVLRAPREAEERFDLLVPVHSHRGNVQAVGHDVRVQPVRRDARARADERHQVVGPLGHEELVLRTAGRAEISAITRLSSAAPFVK